MRLLSWLAKGSRPEDIARAIQGGDAIVRGQSRPPRFRFRTDAALARAALVDTGAAVATMFIDIARRRPELHRVFAEQVGLEHEVWLCAHDDLRRSARMRHVWERLGEGLERCLAPDGPSLPQGSAAGPHR
jgi:hypothetical protein